MPRVDLDDSGGDAAQVSEQLSEQRRWRPLVAIGKLEGNRFGLIEALLGYLVGAFAAAVGVGVYGALAHRPHVTGYATEISGLLGLWLGIAFAALLALRSVAEPRRMRQKFIAYYGMALRPRDIPLGIAAGVLGQYAVVPLSEAPLLPFVPHLFSRLSGPAHSITGGVNGIGFVVLSLLICIGTPFFEELFFRGVILRGLLGAFRRGGALGDVSSAVLAVVASAVIFGLAHYEALETPGLIGAGLVFGTLAAVTHRLGPGMVAHATFNALTIVAIVRAR